MEKQKLQPDILSKVEDWLGSGTSIAHFWRFDDTFIVIASHKGESSLYCLRIFPVGDSLELSQDNVLYTEEGK